MNSWKAIDSGKELRTYRYEIDVTKIKTTDWMGKFLLKEKLQLANGKKWTKQKISPQTFMPPSDIIEKLSKEIKLNKAEFIYWASSITLSFDGTKKLFLDIKTPNIWISADLLVGGSWYWDKTLVNPGGTIGQSVGNMFTTGKKIIKINSITKLLAVLQKNKGKIWGMVVYAHGGLRGRISANTQTTSVFNQKALISELKKYKYKLAKIYMMQCYSGFKGIISESGKQNLSNYSRWTSLSETRRVNGLKNWYTRTYSTPYQKVTSVEVKKISDKNNAYVYEIKFKVK